MSALEAITRFLVEHSGSYEVYTIMVSDRSVLVHATKRPMLTARTHRLEVPLAAGDKREAALERFLETLKEDLS